MKDIKPIDEIETKTKYFDTWKEVEKVTKSMQAFSTLHMHMKESFEGLLKITQSYEGKEQEYQILVKTCLIELFGMIEADIFYYNSFDKHPPQDGTIRFFDKFKLTFDQIALTWERQEIVDEYFRTQSQLIRKLRKIRNNQVHPKLISHLFIPKKRHYKEIVVCFEKYDEMVLKIMRNFFVGIKLPASELLRISTL